MLHFNQKPTYLLPYLAGPEPFTLPYFACTTISSLEGGMTKQFLLSEKSLQFLILQTADGSEWVVIAPQLNCLPTMYNKYMFGSLLVGQVKIIALCSLSSYQACPFNDLASQNRNVLMTQKKCGLCQSMDISQQKFLIDIMKVSIQLRTASELVFFLCEPLVVLMQLLPQSEMIGV